MNALWAKLSLDVCLGSLFLWIESNNLSPMSFAASNWFPSRIAPLFTSTCFPVPAERNHSHIMMLPPYFGLFWMMCSVFMIKIQFRFELIKQHLFIYLGVSKLKWLTKNMQHTFQIFFVKWYPSSVNPHFGWKMKCIVFRISTVLLWNITRNLSWIFELVFTIFSKMLEMFLY